MMDRNQTGRDVAAVAYALDMLPKWIDHLAAGTMAPAGVVEAVRQDMRAAIPAFARLRAAIEETE